jgi:hypothetical protein
MRRRCLDLLLVLPLTACAATPGAGAAVAGASSARAGALEGAWRVVEQASRAPGGAWTVAGPPDRSLYLFTATHYSYMFTRPEPRQPFSGDPNQPTEAEKVRAYDTFVAASGTYALEGSRLTLRAIVHKNPSEMTGEPLHYAAEVRGDTARLTIANPVFQPGRERRTVLARIR